MFRGGGNHSVAHDVVRGGIFASKSVSDVGIAMPTYFEKLASLPSRLAAKKSAFTLAEVLITLGIIGVVAAITLPTLIKSYQKQVLETQLKKEINFIQNAFKKIVADEGASDFVSSSFTVPTVFRGENLYEIDSEKFVTYFNLQSVNPESLFQKMLPENVKGYTLNSGACLAFYFAPEKRGGLESGNFIIVDVNCDSKPNKFGMDRFTFITSQFSDKIVSGGDYDGFIGSDEYQMAKKLCFEDVSLPDNDIIDGAYCGYIMVYNGYKFK